jgi:hypothetical protein
MTHRMRSSLPDKRSRRHEHTTPIFIFLHIPHYEGASSEVWHAETDTLEVRFAGESEKCESLEHYEKSLAFLITILVPA